MCQSTSARTPIFAGMKPWKEASESEPLYTVRINQPSDRPRCCETCHICERHDSVDLDRPHAALFREGVLVEGVCMLCLSRSDAWWRRQLKAKWREYLDLSVSAMPGADTEADTNADNDCRRDPEDAATWAHEAAHCAEMLAYGIIADPGVREHLAAVEGIEVGIGANS